MKQDRICQNCSCFVGEIKDIEEVLGICVEDEAFAPFIDEILENADFSGCYDLYLEKRFNGEKAACDNYEEPELIEISSEDDVYGYILHEKFKHQDVDEILKYLDSSNNNIRKEAIKSLYLYIALENVSAYEGLIDYYMGLDPADSLEEVHMRMEIVEVLYRKISEQKTINAYVNELARTSSNNTTRQLYTKILNHLEKCPPDLTRDPLLELLKKRQYSYKMKKRIIDIINMKHQNWYHTW